MNIKSIFYESKIALKNSIIKNEYKAVTHK